MAEAGQAGGVEFGADGFRGATGIARPRAHAQVSSWESSREGGKGVQMSGSLEAATYPTM